MKIESISLQQFRNIDLARLEFDPNRPTFFVGKNGQGKSNLLEGLGLVTAIRSFRTYELSPLIQLKQKEARLYYRVVLPGDQRSSIEMQLSSRSRTLFLDDEPVNRMADYVGQFPSVVFCADDIQLIKGGPQLRRRYFDLLFSIVDNDYLIALQRYHRALKERNQAVKNQMTRGVVLAYDKVLVTWGLQVIQKRIEWISKLTPLFEQNYLRVSGEEVARLDYKPSIVVENETAYLELLEKQFEKDRILGSTTAGPHRDDYRLEVEEMGAKIHGSDGQQRSIVLALKLAQIDLIETTLSQKPIVLLDDILGELDEGRRTRFWEIFDRDCQVFASGTVIPTGPSELNWRIYDVENGEFTLRSSDGESCDVIA